MLTIDAQMINCSLEGARQANLDLKRLLHKCQIDEADLLTPGKRLPVDKVVRLQNYCTGLLSDEAAGLLSKPTAIGCLRYMALSVVHTRNLGRALERLAEFYDLFNNTFRIKIEHNQQSSRLVVERISEQSALNDYAVDNFLSIQHRFLGWLCDERIIPTEVAMDFPPPVYEREYRHIYYGAPVSFNQPQISLSFPRKLLGLPIVQTEASVEGFLRRAPLDIYLQIDARGHHSVVVRKQLLEGFESGCSAPSLESVAATMDTTPQTLRRRLRDEDTSFSAIKAQVRCDIAIRYLGYGDMSIEQVAEKTGYAEASAFIRAFKLWTGYTPMQFRRGSDDHFKQVR